MNEEIKRIDVPKNVCEELERLHDVIMDNGGTNGKEMREWAMSKIDQIHKIFFMGQIIISNSVKGEIE